MEGLVELQVYLSEGDEHSRIITGAMLLNTLVELPTDTISRMNLTDETPSQGATTNIWCEVDPENKLAVEACSFSSRLFVLLGLLMTKPSARILWFEESKGWKAKCRVNTKSWARSHSRYGRGGGTSNNLVMSISLLVSELHRINQHRPVFT